MVGRRSQMIWLHLQHNLELPFVYTKITTTPSDRVRFLRAGVQMGPAKTLIPYMFEEHYETSWCTSKIAGRAVVYLVVLLTRTGHVDYLFGYYSLC